MSHAPFRSLLPYTLTLLLGVLVVGGFGLTASAQDGAGSSTSTCTPRPGVACVRVPAALQEDLARERIAVAEAKLVVLRSQFQGGSAVQSPRVTALNTEISTLKARIAAGFTDYLLSMPYATARGPGKHGIAFSKLTYRNPPEHNPANTSVAMESADPTQIVLWGEATHANVVKAFKGFTPRGAREQRFTRPPDNAYLWEDDFPSLPFVESAPQYIAMQNSADPVAGEWVWVRSTGLHPTGDVPATKTRHHMRFFSSSDTKRANVSALGPQKGHFEHWTVIAAHHEDPTPAELKELTDEFLDELISNPESLIDLAHPYAGGLLVIGKALKRTVTRQGFKKTLARAGLSHKVVSWDDGQERVVDSITIPLVGGGRQAMSWVKGIERRRWGNNGVQQGVNYTLDGYLIKMVAPVQSTLPAPPKPAAPTLRAHRNSIIVTKPGGDATDGTWFDYRYSPKTKPIANSEDLAYRDWKPASDIVISAETQIKGLKYETTYQVQVRKYNARARSEWSDATTITLGEAPPCENGTTITRPASKPGLVADCKALLTIAAALGATPALNWSGDVPIGEWEGVVRTGTPRRVTGLDLARQDSPQAREPSADPGEEPAFYASAERTYGGTFSGSLPAALGKLERLTFLDLRGHELEGAIPAELGDLARLQLLLLSGNDLSGAIPAELGELSKLRVLQLNGNGLDGPIPAALGSLASLRTLKLHGNDLSGELPVELGDLAQLRDLRLHENELSGAIPEELTKLTKLNELYLRDNDFTCMPAGLAQLARRNDVARLALGPCPPEVGIAAVAPSVKEGADAVFTVTRSRSETSALVVLVHVTDGEDGDFIKGPPPTRVTIPANATRARLEVPTDDDDKDEENGVVTARLRASKAYTIDEEASAAAVAVRDNDVAPCENGVTIPNHATNAALVSDCETLLAVKDRLRGSATLNWGPTTPIRSWDGLTVTGSGRLSLISLGNRGLTGEIPPELGSLSHLIVLNLHNNRLTGSIPHELTKLGLYTLRLSGNPGLTGCVPASLRRVNTNDLASLGLADCVLGVATQRFETSGNKGWAKAGDVITAHFTTAVPLAAPPAATFAGNEDNPVTARPTGSSGMIWTVTYTVTAGDTNGLAGFNLGEIRDDDGNTRDPAPVSTGITIDTKAPTVTVPPPTTTGLARADQVIRVAFTASEPLGARPVGTIAGENATISGSGTSWTASYKVLADDTNGLAFLDLEAVRDRAGNESADPARASSGVTIDTKAPTVKFHSATSSTGTRSAEAGDTIRVDFTVSEPLAADPKMTIAGIKADVTAVAASNGASWTATATVVAGIAFANAPFDLGELRDAAGNTNDPDSDDTGIAIVDDTAPTVTLGTPTSTNDAGSWAKADDKITVPFTVSEALASDPVATIAGQNATITGSGLSWSAAYTVVSSDPNGHALFDLETLTDGAGNSADPDAATLAIKIDTKAPTVTDHDFRTTAAAGEASDEDDTITVTFTTSEALALPPWATIAGETATVTGAGTSWTATYEVVRGDNAADAAFNLGPLRDAAGNINDPDSEDTGITVKTVVLRTLTTTVSPPNSGGVKVTVVAAAEGAQADFLGGQREWKHPINTTVKAVASANPDYRFDRWSRGTCTGGSEPYTAADGCTVLLDQNKSVTALFKEQCTLTVEANTGGEASIEGASGKTWRGDCGTTRTVVADADPGYRFDGWSAGVTTRSARTTTVVVNQTTTVTADFEAQCTLAATAGAGGSVYPTRVTVDCGEPLTSTATANDGYCVTRWDPAIAGAVGQESCRESLLLSVPTMANTPSSHAHVASFHKKPVPQCELTVIPGDGGDAGDRSWRGDCGTTRTLYAVPDPSYRFGGWSAGVSNRSATRTTITVNEDTTIRASFIAQCAVTATPNPSAGGRVVPSSGTVDCGQPFRPTAYANNGYCYVHPPTGGRFAGGSDEAEGQQSCPTSRPLSLRTEGTTPGVFVYTVHFRVKPVPQCTLTVEDGDGGSASGSWTGDCGTSRAISADPDSNYRFGRWSGGSGVSGRTSSSTTVTVSKTMTVTASFVAQCTVTATPKPSSWGSVSPSSGTVDCGDAFSPTATANDGYCYSHKTGGLFASGSEAEGQQSCQTSPTIDLPTSGSAGSVFVYTVHFKVKPVPQCTLTVADGDGGDASGTWTGPCGTSRSISADPDSDYRFGRWSGGSGVSDRTSSSTTVTVSKTMTVTASFVAQCAVTVTAGPGGSVSPTSGTVDCGQPLSVTATATTGYCYWYRDGGRIAGGSDDAEGQQSCRTSPTLDLPTRIGSPSAYAYTVYFRVKPASTYTLTVTADTGGTPSGGGSKTARTTATARVAWNNVQYQFTSWTGTCSRTSTSTSSATCSVFMSANKSVHANLSKRTCTIKAVAGTGGSVSGGGSVHCGVGSTTVRATASVGYCFTSWSTALGASTSVAGQSTCTVSSSRTATRPTTARTYTAKFTATNYTLTVNRGTGSGSYPARSYARISADAWICQFGTVYNFSGWTGTTLTARTVRVYMNRDRTITANFATRTSRSCFGDAAQGAEAEELTPVDEPIPADAEGVEDTGELPVDPPAGTAGDGDTAAGEGDGSSQAEGGQAEGGSGDPPDPPEGGDDP